MKQINVNFHECEHEGDLGGYVYDLRQSGAKILHTTINDESEVGNVVIEVENFEAFMEKFKKTSSCDFSNLSHY